MLPYKSLKKKKDKIRKIEKPLREALALPQWSDMIACCHDPLQESRKKGMAPRAL